MLIHWRPNLQDKPTKVCLLDWQFSRPASPADDFVMYICSSTEKQLRDEYYKDLLGIYYDSLADIVRRCESDPEKLFTYEDLEAQLAPFGIYGVMEAPLTVSLMVADFSSNADKDTNEENLGNKDKEEGHMTSFDPRTEDKYKQRLSDVLEDARKYGWTTQFK